jgi:hypothetical protein
MRLLLAVGALVAVSCSGRSPDTTSVTAPKSTPTRPAEVAPATPSATGKYESGGITVEVVSAKVSPVMVKMPLGPDQPTNDAYTAVTVRLTNSDPNRKVDYRPWSYGPNALRAAPALTDQNGNSYKVVNVGINDVVGQVGRSASLYPDKPITDLILFEPPLQSATALTLELPASAVGQEGKIRLRVDLRRGGVE